VTLNNASNYQTSSGYIELSDNELSA